MKLLRMCGVLSVGLVLMAGCRKPASGAAAGGAAAAAEARAALESDREQMEQVPPPSKSQFMAIHSMDSWQNPYLTVNAGLLVVHVTQADTNPSPVGLGSMVRPEAARRQAIDIGFEKLGEAMTSIPRTAWPYGRVVGIEEARKTPESAEPTVRRNMEATISRLNDLGIVVYDVGDGRVQ